MEYTATRMTPLPAAAPPRTSYRVSKVGLGMTSRNVCKPCMPLAADSTFPPKQTAPQIRHPEAAVSPKDLLFHWLPHHLGICPSARLDPEYSDSCREPFRILASNRAGPAHSDRRR